MPKQKTHRGAAKRLSLTKNGKVKRAQAYKSHILTKKPTKRTRNLRKTAYVADAMAKMVKKLIPYKEAESVRRRPKPGRRAIKMEA